MKRIACVLLLSALLGWGGAAGCGSSGASATAENLEEAADTLTEESEQGAVSWYIGPDGKVKALVKGPDGKPIENASATVTFGGASGTKVPLAVDPKSKLLVGQGPKLQGELIEVQYTITAAGKTWNGVLYLPPEGTAGIEENAKKAESKDVPVDKPGPNGGVVQVVGEDVVEVVADQNSGQVRVYVLDAELKPAEVGERKIKLGLQGNGTELVDLSPGPTGIYFVGKINARVDPTKVTIAVTNKSRTVVVLVGHGRGKRVVLTPGKGPKPKILVVGPRWIEERKGKDKDKEERKEERKEEKKDKKDDKKDNGKHKGHKK
jgi:hypothetical protein